MKTKTLKVPLLPGLMVLAILLPSAGAYAEAHAPTFEDKVADVMAWVVLIVAPIIGIAVFWLLHILPEKIAEKRQHPQTAAIQTLCLLSLFFGGLLWPLAWLWAFSKPVLYKMAYGTDKVAHGHEDTTPPTNGDAEELKQLLERVAELQGKLAGPGQGA